MINHRVNIHSSIDDIRQHVVQTLQPVAEEYNLGISGWGAHIHPSGESKGTLYLSDAFEIPHGPAPITPTDLGNAAWRVFAGTSRGMWASREEVSEDGRVVDLSEADELILAPFMGTGVRHTALPSWTLLTTFIAAEHRHQEVSSVARCNDPADGR